MDGTEERASFTYRYSRCCIEMLHCFIVCFNETFTEHYAFTLVYLKLLRVHDFS
jgi:hypothetical protein